MKALIFHSIAGFLIFTSGAFAEDYNSAFHKAHNYKCRGGYYRISSTGAEDVAGAVAAGKYRLKDMLNLYYQTCDFDQSVRIAEAAKNNKSYIPAFDKSLNYKCRGGSYKLNAFQAEAIGNDIAAKKYDTDDMLNAYYRTCDFEQAARIAEDAAKKTLDLDSFFKAGGYKCKGGSYYIGNTGAESVAKAVAAKKVKLSDVLDAFYSTCDFDQANRIAEDVTIRKSDLTAFQKVLHYKCRGGSYKVMASGAEEIAKEVAKSSIDLNSFLDMYYSTCEFDRSLRMAKAARSSGRSAGDDRGSDSSISAE